MTETYASELAAKAAEDLGDLDANGRLELLGVMTPHEMSTCLAFIAGFAPSVFDASIVRDSTLADLLNARLDEEYANDPQAYCATCGANVGIFIGHGAGWHHFTGEGTTEAPVSLYEADHEPVILWRA